MTEPIRRYCPALIRRNGVDRPCGQVVGLTVWTDHTGVERCGCTNHAGGLKRRFPESVPDRTGAVGSLGLGSPWTRGKFAPSDVIEVENRIPGGYRIVVTSHAGSPHQFDLRAYSPEGSMVFERTERHDPVIDAMQMAARLQMLASPDAMDLAKAEADRIESWSMAPDMTVSVPLDMTRPETAA